mmetsp:Transcript_11219/g.10830  ORF Transcript_11219/g.10830 Transcript_11219/m.10830 type:complete len:534 (+) Transcript_11219:266-1867(+)
MNFFLLCPLLFLQQCSSFHIPVIFQNAKQLENQKRELKLFYNGYRKLGKDKRSNLMALEDSSTDTSIFPEIQAPIQENNDENILNDKSDIDIVKKIPKKVSKKKIESTGNQTIVDNVIKIVNDVYKQSINGTIQGHAHTTESRAKISAANKGKAPWNTGKQHSEETRLKIAAKTKEAMLRRKMEKANALGFNTFEEFDAHKLQEKIKIKAEKDKHKVKGLTAEGRKRISESLKNRWADPDFRLNYTAVTRGNRSHSPETRALISAAITTKWQDAEYRAKISSPPSDSVKARISATLKARWEDPEFREKMLTRTFERTDEWRALVSDKIRLKWSDPEYRSAVAIGIKNSNKTISLSAVHRVNRGGGVSDATKQRRQVLELKRKEREAKSALRDREKSRKIALKLAKVASRSEIKGKSIKELLGGELWFEEKLKRRKDGNPFMDDEALEKQLALEWDQEDISLDGNEDMEDAADLEENTDIEDKLRMEYANDEVWEEIDVDSLDEGLDIIEVYDEDGELVGTYTGAEFDKLKRNK